MTKLCKSLVDYFLKRRECFKFLMFKLLVIRISLQFSLSLVFTEITQDWEISASFLSIYKVKVGAFHPIQQPGSYDILGQILRIVTCGSGTHTEVTACD